MYQIVGRENLEVVNFVADRSMEVVRELSDIEENKKVSVDSDTLMSLATGYLFLYHAVLDHGILPSQKSAKHRIFKVH
jgi:hypothetical protein